MSTRLHELAERVTHRLRMDPDLRRDVAEELTSHLDASTAEYIDAGEPVERAEAQAMRALGDEQDLADQLWRANRGRIRLRFWLRWTARVVLVPAVLLAVALIPMQHRLEQRDARQLQALMAWQMEPGVAGVDGAAQPVAIDDHALLRHLDERERRLVLGDPEAQSALESAAAMVEAYPDDPAVHARYALTWIGSLDSDALARGEADTQALLDTLERGKQLEPDNGLYDLLKASLLVYRAGVLNQRDGEMQLELDDREAMEAVVAAFVAASQSAYLRTHGVDLVGRQMALLPASRSANEYMLRQSIFASAALRGGIQYSARSRFTARYVAAYARQLGEEGRVDEARSLLSHVQHVGVRMVEDAGLLTIVLTGSSIAALGLSAEVHVLEEAGLDDEAADVQAVYDALLHEHTRFRETLHVDLPPLSSPLHLMRMNRQDQTGAVWIDRAERVWLSQVALLTGLWMLLAVTACAALASIVSLLRHRDGSERPRLVWPNMLEIAVAAGVVLAVMVGFYAVRFWMMDVPTIAAASAAGLLAALGVVLIGAMLVRRAMARQGLPVAALSKWWHAVTVVCVIGLGVLMFDIPVLSTRHGNSSPLTPMIAALVLTATWALLGVVRLSQLRKRTAMYRRTLVRSALPWLAMATLTVGLVGGGVLLISESTTIDALDRHANVGITHERDHSAVTAYRDWLADSVR
ncbi:permease prefix domain 1-containing protein [Phycisphaerales bacterium AB-hyl4]|uniref:Permease prefix domain 1-containing protein n=1 Tax=Natronomicrosphaera hydrolytica TaxID=3242702 RepID=A0ABV4UAF0_9BACT